MNSYTLISRRAAATLLLLVLALVPFATALAQEAPAIPTLVNPADGQTYNTHAPLLQWTDVEADTYKIVIKKADGTKYLKYKLNDADVCSEFLECSYSLATSGDSFDENGEYTWKIVAKNEFGKSKSEPATFIIDFPGAPTLVSPLPGATVTGSTTFSFEEVVAATAYKLVVKNTDTKQKFKVSVDTTVCTSGICTVSLPETLEPGSYSWKVTAQQPPLPNKSKSEKQTFTVEIL